jgi:hypothetical protein
VARLAGSLAERSGMGADEARRVQVAALVHDVGLTSLPDSILRRDPSALSMSARSQYQSHSVLGQRMLGSVADLNDMARWIRHHHERWDGRGYPDHLAEDAIPLPSRIIALADGYLEAIQFEPGTAPRWRAAQETNGAFDPGLLRVLDEELREEVVQLVRARSPITTGPAVAPTPRVRTDAGVDDVQTVAVSVKNLRSGMVIFGQVLSTSGAVLVRSGERLTAERLQRIQQLCGEGLLLTTDVEVTVGTLVTDSAPPLVSAQEGPRPG